MNRTRPSADKFGTMVCAMLLGYAAYGQPSVSVEVVFPAVEIHAASDFYEPLTPHGRWEVVGAYGRCWIPVGVDADWRPYSDGYWQYTDVGWYWASNEPWAWATYHYGRWDMSPQFGWYWMPQTQWSPAWVSWHSGGGYIGWAPLYPSATFTRSGFIEIDRSVISPRAYVFVEEGRFLQPVRRSTVVVHNTTIINQTVNITNIKIVNNTVINGGPATPVIEKASGRKVQAVPARELRHREETAVVAKQRTPAPTNDKKVPAPMRGEAATGAKSPPVAPVPPPIHKPAAPAQEPAAPAPKKHEVPSEKPKPVPGAPTLKPDGNRPPQVKVKEPTQPKIERPERPGTPPPDRQVPPTVPEKPGEKEKGGPKPGDKDHEKKPKE